MSCSLVLVRLFQQIQFSEGCGADTAFLFPFLTLSYSNSLKGRDSKFLSVTSPFVISYNIESRTIRVIIRVGLRCE